MSISEPNPDRCHVTLSPSHIVRPGRFLKTNPLIAGKETENRKLEMFRANSSTISHLFREIVIPSHNAFCCSQQSRHPFCQQWQDQWWRSRCFHPDSSSDFHQTRWPTDGTLYHSFSMQWLAKKKEKKEKEKESYLLHSVITYQHCGPLRRKDSNYNQGCEISQLSLKKANWMATPIYLRNRIPRLNYIFTHCCTFLPALLFLEIQGDRQAVVQPVQSWYL